VSCHELSISKEQPLVKHKMRYLCSAGYFG
jgi:hypothetical protein